MPPAPATVREMQAMARAFLERKELPEARLEADLLVAHALGLPRLGMLLQLDRPVEPAEIDRARDALVRRARREPVAYITGEREFYGRPFCVGPGCLIPRPETEGIVDLAKDWMRQGLVPVDARILDLGTGSGALAISLALEWPKATVVAAELSADALAWARRNGERHAAQVAWHLGDGFEVARREGPFDLVVSNPPYVRRADLPSLAPEVRDHEPHEALFAPDGDPDAFLRRLLEGWSQWMAPLGRMIVELGYDQSPRVLGLLRQSGLEGELVRDLSRIERLASAWKPASAS